MVAHGPSRTNGQQKLHFEPFVDTTSTDMFGEILILMNRPPKRKPFYNPQMGELFIKIPHQWPTRFYQYASMPTKHARKVLRAPGRRFGRVLRLCVPALQKASDPQGGYRSLLPPTKGLRAFHTDALERAAASARAGERGRDVGRGDWMLSPTARNIDYRSILTCAQKL